jgi:hypothetical protein
MMRARPDEYLRKVTGYFKGYLKGPAYDIWLDKAQRRQIADSLAAVGIEVDAAALNDLEGLASFVLVQGALMPGGRLPTPKQQARELRKALALLEPALTARIELGLALRTALTDKIAELHQRVGQLDAKGSASAGGAPCGIAADALCV